MSKLPGAIRLTDLYGNNYTTSRAMLTILLKLRAIRPTHYTSYLRAKFPT